jgi:hypothetical protein
MGFDSVPGRSLARENRDQSCQNKQRNARAERSVQECEWHGETVHKITPASVIIPQENSRR